MTLQPNQPCPCGAGKNYKRCCRPLHRGGIAPDPEALMRSRYSAYAAGLVDYIMATTDPDGPMARADQAAWSRELTHYCQVTEFVQLQVLSATADGEGGEVNFLASLRQQGHELNLAERSRFRRRNGRWLYHSGDVRD